jgi:hypothetical protein
MTPWDVVDGIVKAKELSEMKMITNALLLLFALLFLPESLAAQPPVTHSALPPAQPLPGEITLQQAITNAQHFLQQAGLPPSHAPIQQVWLHANPYGLRIWTFQWGGDYAFEVAARTGRVVFFDNNRRIWEQVHHIGRTGRPLFSTKAQWQHYIWQFARRIGLPANAYLVGMSQFADNDPQHTDANPAGSVNAVFSSKPHGYPFLDMGDSMYLDFDPQDGQLVQMFYHWGEVLPESWRVGISEQAALRIAQAALQKVAAEARASHQYGFFFYPLVLQPTQKPRLGYVVPNSSWGSRYRTNTTYPMRARLAWEFRLGKRVVWVDAGDGSLLGGIEYK